MSALVNNLEDAIEAIEDSDVTDLVLTSSDVGVPKHMAGMNPTNAELTPRQQALIDEMNQELEASDDDDLDSPSDIAAAIEHRKELRQQAVDSINNHRAQKQEQCFDIAESWATKPDLSPAERCHGVAWEIQKNFGDTFGVDINGTVITADVGQEYATLYDVVNHDKIRDGLLRSAASLFD
jgi:hypothetical protein